MHHPHHPNFAEALPQLLVDLTQVTSTVRGIRHDAEPFRLMADVEAATSALGDLWDHTVELSKRLYDYRRQILASPEKERQP